MRTTTFRVAAFALTIAGGLMAGAGPALADTASTLPDGYYREAYSSTIYQVQDGFHSALTSSEYTADGSPTPAAAPTEYVKYPWSKSVYAVTYWPDGWQWDELTYPEWVQAGSPLARTAGWVDGSTVERYDTGTELFLTDPDGAVHKLTYGEWVAAASPQPVQQSNQGYLKLSWSPDVFEMSNLATGAGAPMTAAQWAAAGRPTPKVVPWIAGETWERYAGSSTIYYSGPGVYEAVTGPQWAAAGRPAPHVIGATPTTAGTGSSTYTNSDGATVQSPVSSTSSHAGATAQCKDGAYSFSQHHSGTCSGHGGVARWL